MGLTGTLRLCARDDIAEAGSRLAAFILAAQQADGSWLYSHLQPELGACAKTTAALALALAEWSAVSRDLSVLPAVRRAFGFLDSCRRPNLLVPELAHMPVGRFRGRLHHLFPQQAGGLRLCRSPGAACPPGRGADPVKILQVCKHFYPRVTGVTAHVDHLGRELQALGHETAVTTWGDETGRESIHGLEVLRARNGDRQTAAKLIMDFRPDVIHAHSIWSTTDLAVKAARKLGRPYVITTHGTWQLLESSRGGPRDVHPLSRFWRRKIFWPSILRGAGAVIALNALEERDATEAGVSQDKLRRIPNAVDLELFSPAGSRTKPVRRPWPGRFTILFAGAMEANKGIFEAITAASMLRQSHPQARWLFCGEGPDLAHARKETSRAGLDEVVLFMDRVARQDMPDLYRSVDLVIVPSHMEAFSTVLLEAMASSLPCVGTDVGGTPEIIDDFRTGLIVPPGDSSALAQTVGWLAEHPAEAAALGRAGRKRAERNFGWRNVAARIADTYRQVLVPLAIVLLLGVFRPALAAQVAAVDILTMVDPRTGQAVSAGTSDWRGENPVWNGKEVRLSAARGETVAFQIVLLTDPGEDLAGINVQADLPGLAWRAFRAWHIWNTPEVAVPLGNEAPSFDIPSRLPEERRATRGVRAWGNGGRDRYAPGGFPGPA